MGKSCPNLEAPHRALKQQAGGPNLVPQAAAALDEAASAVHGQTVTGNLLEGTLPFDCRVAPHQPVVPSLEGL
jgi:hypothetical protein